MAGICFFFEPNDVDVWSGRDIDLDAWNYAAKVAGDVDQMTVVNRTDIKLRSPDDALHFSVVDELPELQNAVYVACPWDTEHSTPLWEFDHDVDWYVFGPAAGWGELPGPSIHVPQAGRGALHSVHVATTVMLDRYRRLQWP